MALPASGVVAAETAVAAAGALVALGEDWVFGGAAAHAASTQANSPTIRLRVIVFSLVIVISEALVASGAHGHASSLFDRRLGATHERHEKSKPYPCVPC